MVAQGEGALQVDSDHGAPLVLAYREEHPISKDAGVVDQDVPESSTCTRSAMCTVIGTGGSLDWERPYPRRSYHDMRASLSRSAATRPNEPPDPSAPWTKITCVPPVPVEATSRGRPPIDSVAYTFAAKV